MNTPKEALIIGAAGTAALTFAGWQVRKALGVRHWRRTNGRVLSAEVRRTEVLSDGDANLDVVARFAYTVDGRDYVGERLGLFTMQTRHKTSGAAQAHVARLPPGAEIPVWYDPANPADAVSIRSIPPGYWIIGVAGLVFVAGALITLVRGVAT